MYIAPSLVELQTDFLAALYGDKETAFCSQLVGAGLAPTARLRIYRHAAEQIHLDALRTAYPAVFALVGKVFFEQTAVSYRRAYPSRSGNLQAFGNHFADFLERLPGTRRLAYLGDVARLEWCRQLAALASEAAPLTRADFDAALAAAKGPVQMAFQPGMQCWTSAHPVLTIWRYAMQPTPERLALPPTGDRMLVWRSENEVAMASLDAASFACIDALVHGSSLETARCSAKAPDRAFDFAICITSLVDAGLVTSLTSVPHMEQKLCTDFSN